MQIFLIKSAETSKEVFTKVMDLLQSVPGPISFSCDPESLIDFDDDDVNFRTIENLEEFTSKKFETVNYSMSYESMVFPLNKPSVSWATLFDKCRDYRKHHRIAQDAFVVLLTGISNDYNWFAHVDSHEGNNGFVHTSDWEYFIECPNEFPIAFEIIALFLQKFIFKDLKSIREKTHLKSIGCVSDMCMEKKDIILKMRTADICRTCMTTLKGVLPEPIIHHALALMESLRIKMLYAQNFRQNVQLSPMQITSQYEIMLPGFENRHIRLTPLFKALYFIFLKYPEGIMLSHLCDYREELYDMFVQLSNTGTREQMRKKIDQLCNYTSKSAENKMSKIKNIFEVALGKELAKHYYIHGANGYPKKINLDRSLVHWERPFL